MKFRTEGSVISLVVLLFLLGCAVVMEVITRSVDPRKPFDERQDHARGVAGRCGFFTMALFSLGMWIFIDLMETDITYEFVLRTSVYLGVTVFATVAIWKDAYVALTQSYETALMSLGLWTVYRWMRLFDELDGFPFSLSDTEGWTEVGAVAMFTWITGLLAVKWLLKKKEESDVE